MMALHLKLDEIIRATRSAHNELLNIEELTDEELTVLSKRYEKLAQQIKSRIEIGLPDTGSPGLEKEP